MAGEFGGRVVDELRTDVVPAVEGVEQGAHHHAQVALVGRRSAVPDDDRGVLVGRVDRGRGAWRVDLDEARQAADRDALRESLVATSHLRRVEPDEVGLCDERFVGFERLRFEVEPPERRLRVEFAEVVVGRIDDHPAVVARVAEQRERTLRERAQEEDDVGLEYRLLLLGGCRLVVEDRADLDRALLGETLEDQVEDLRARDPSGRDDEQAQHRECRQPSIDRPCSIASRAALPVHPAAAD